MKIAIFHNYLDNIGGAEMVTLTLARELNADIYTCASNEENIRKMGFDVPIITLPKIPNEPPFRQQFAERRLRKINLSSSYDYFIISGDWAVSAAVHNKPNLWYVHTPKREIWDLYSYTRAYIVPEGRYIKNLYRYIFDIWVLYNRFLDRRYVKHAEKIVCNSINVQRRIETYLKRDARVIYPPTDTEKYHFGKVGDYWLSVNRLTPPKRVEIQMEAFKHNPHERLIIVGSYEEREHFLKYKKYLESIKPPNVEMRSHVSFEELTTLYANCKGFITTAQDEDFGMTAIEAMASGKPVIAPNEGGYKESVIHKKTGMLIDDISPEKISAVIEEVGKNPEAYKEYSLERAKLFSVDRFIHEIKEEIGYES